MPDNKKTDESSLLGSDIESDNPEKKLASFIDPEFINGLPIVGPVKMLLMHSSLSLKRVENAIELMITTEEALSFYQGDLAKGVIESLFSDIIGFDVRVVFCKLDQDLTPASKIKDLLQATIDKERAEISKVMKACSASIENLFKGYRVTFRCIDGDVV